MTSIEVIRLIAEALALIAAVSGIIWALSRQIMHIVRSVDKLTERVGDEKEPKPGTILSRLMHQDKCTDDLKKVVEAQGKEAREAILQHSREQTTLLAQTARETREIAALLAAETKAAATKASDRQQDVVERLTRVEVKLDVPVKLAKTEDAT